MSQDNRCQDFTLCPATGALYSFQNTAGSLFCDATSCRVDGPGTFLANVELAVKDEWDASAGLQCDLQLARIQRHRRLQRAAR